MSDTGRVPGPLIIDKDRRTAWWGPRPLSLTPRAFDLLACLADHPAGIVSKADLRTAVWRDAHVDEANLTQTVFMVRRALRDAGAPDLVLTIPRVGYRLAPSPAAGTPLPNTADRQPAASAWRVRPRSIALGGFAVVASVLLLIWWSGERRGVRSVAVVPFVNRLGPGAQFMIDGLSDRIARDVARGIPVRLATATVEDEVAARDLGRALAVDAVLTGRVENRDHGLVMSAALTDTHDGRVIWRAERTGPTSPTAWVPAAAADLVADLVRTTWPHEPWAPAVDRQADARADFVRARALLARGTADALPQAMAAFRDAIVRDPEYAEAYAGLADAYTLAGLSGVLPRNTAYPEAKDLARKALEMDGRLPDAHSSLGLLLQMADKNWGDAESRYRRAIELDPTHVTARRRYARLLDATERPAEALREIDVALALAPVSAEAHADKGVILAHQQRFTEALVQFARALALDPTHAEAAFESGWALARDGRHEDALAAFDRAGRLGTAPSLVQAGRGYTLARAGRSEEARGVFREIERRRDILDLHRKHVLLAVVSMGLGETDEAMRRLLAGAPMGEPDARVAYWEVRGHPDYQEFLRRSGF